jgi:PAS domain-containing protein
MSVNEELQSTNEELETSKEELQSLNEELGTVNAQLQTKIDEVERASDDLSNLLTSTNIATVFLDPQLRIRRFTPAATRLFTLIPSDVGRPLADIAQKFADPKLLDDAQAVLQHLAPRQLEVQAEAGRRYFRQVLPYRTQDSRINGVVLTFSDVAADALYAARAELEGALTGLQAILDNAADAIITIDEPGTCALVQPGRRAHVWVQGRGGDGQRHPHAHALPARNRARQVSAPAPQDGCRADRRDRPRGRGPSEGRDDLPGGSGRERVLG